LRKWLAGAVALFAAAHPASASPWNRIDGGVFVSTKIDYFSSSTAISRFYRLDTDNYLEWGVTPRLMAGGKVLYGQAWTENATAATSAGGVSEGAGFLQYQVRRNGKNALAVKLAAGFNSDALSGAPRRFSRRRLSRRAPALWSRHHRRARKDFRRDGSRVSLAVRAVGRPVARRCAAWRRAFRTPAAARRRRGDDRYRRRAGARR
jgi:hypothetical protein